MVARKIALPLALVAALTAVPAAAQPRCTQEVLAVGGTPVTLVYCVAGLVRSEGDEVLVPVSASYSSPGGAFSATRELHFVGGEGSSRILESLELTRVGLTGILHLTLVYAGGMVRVEGALLTPGGITIK
jgi:hypothetical protein